MTALFYTRSLGNLLRTGYKTSFIKDNNIRFMSHTSLNDMYFGLVSLALAKNIYLCRHISTHYRINVSNSISANILHTKDIFFNVLSEINDRLYSEQNWQQIKNDLLLAEKAQLSEFYERLQQISELRVEAAHFKEKIGSFLNYYLKR